MVTKNLNTEEAKEAVSNGTFFGFVPHRFTEDSTSALFNFSKNILFMKSTMRNDGRVTGTALYEPDLATFKLVDKKFQLTYKNIYGNRGEVIIYYDLIDKSWHGEKFINGARVGQAAGPTWELFFIHLTMMGLQNGEPCKFELSQKH